MSTGGTHKKKRAILRKCANSRNKVQRKRYEFYGTFSFGLCMCTQAKMKD